MTIQRIRELLGKKVEHLTDDQLALEHEKNILLTDGLMDMIVRENNREKPPTTNPVQSCKLTKKRKVGNN
jgi:hypothetical protein